MPLSLETCVARHLGDREEQQDRVSLFPHPDRRGTVMAVLADGMGGHSGGSMAAEQIILKAKQNFETYKPISESPRELLSSIINEAHLVIRLTRFTSEKDPHSTAVILMLQPNRVDWVYCGDSRLYQFQGDQTIYRSADHSLVGELVRKGRLSAEQAENHPQRNVLLSCLGSEREPRIDYGQVEGLSSGLSFLLCSDGLWGYISDDELAATISMLPAREAASRLISLARERAEGQGDNISLAVIKLVEVNDESAPSLNNIA